MSDSENVKAGSVLNISFRVCPSGKKKQNKTGSQDLLQNVVVKITLPQLIGK